jgi:hypothetical protein
MILWENTFVFHPKHLGAKFSNWNQNGCVILEQENKATSAKTTRCKPVTVLHLILETKNEEKK